VRNLGNDGWEAMRMPPDITPDALARQLIANKHFDKHERHVYLDHIVNTDLHLALAGKLMMVADSSLVGDDNVYRISIFPKRVDVICFGLESIDSCLEGHYSGVDALPNWVKERLAVLNMIPVTPPMPEVEGIGRRISSHVYWVFAPNAGREASTSA
jgi:hypothetical protein